MVDKAADSSGTTHSTPAFWKKKRFWFAAAFALLLYPTVATAVLWSGLLEKVLKSEDLRVEIAKPAYSVIPGDFHLEGIKVYVNGETQFTLFCDAVHARVDILPLFQRTFSLSWLSAENVKFRMRVQQEGDAAQAPRTQAFPPLNGLPGSSTVSEEQAETSEERESPWTVRLEDLEVNVTELWFFEYRYLGSGQLKGGFSRGPNTMSVQTSVQQLGPGKLLYGAAHPISHNFRGKVQAEIPELDPSKHADLSFFDFVKAKISLQADIEDLAHLSNYVEGGEVTKGQGHFTFSAELNEGALSKGSEVAYETEALEFLMEKIAIRSDLKLWLQVNEKPILDSHSKSTLLTFNPKTDTRFTLQLANHEEHASLSSANLNEDVEVSSARVELPKITSPDLNELQNVAGSDWQPSAKEGTASLSLNMDEEGRFHGPFRASLSGLELRAPPMTMSLNSSLSFQTSVDLEHSTLMLSQIEVDAEDVDFLIGEEAVNDWWLRLRGEKFWLNWSQQDLSAKGELAAKNAEPMIRTVAHGKGGVPGIVADVVTFPDVRAAAEARIKGDTFDLMLENIETSLIDFSGRVFQKGEKNQLALLIGGKTVSIGLYKDPEKTQVKAFAGTRWLNEKLEKFPAPKESVAPPKP